MPFLRLLPLLALAAAAPLQPPAAVKFPLIHAVSADQTLIKHLYSVSLPPGAWQFVGLTGNVSFTTSQNHFGEALISVAYLAAGDCGAINNTRYASYTDPGFPPLIHLASFILKSTRTGTVSLPVNAGFADGCGWGPAWCWCSMAAAPGGRGTRSRCR